MPWLARVIELRSRQPGASLYFVTDPDGEKIAGNVETVPAAILDQTGDRRAQVVPYMSRDEEGSQTRTRRWCAWSELPDGVRVLVGRDVSEREAAGRRRAALADPDRRR